VEEKRIQFACGSGTLQKECIYLAIIPYEPPPDIFPFVAMADMERLVKNVTPTQSSVMTRVNPIPAWPVTCAKIQR
jgi:hypothetical protein